jgi:hypothetical protein
MLRFKEREIAIVFVKGMLYFCSCEPYSTSNKTETILNELRLFVPIRYPKLGHGVCVLTVLTITEKTADFFLPQKV